MAGVSHAEASADTLARLCLESARARYRKVTGMVDREPTQRFFESQRLRLSYWDWGNEDAPPLVFVHGGSDHARSWDRMVRGVGEGYHVLSLDVRGHGDSDWAPGSQYAIPDVALDIARLIEVAGQGQPARVVGHSYGASSTLVAAAMFPELFAAAIAIEGTHTMNPKFASDGMGPHWARTWAEHARALETQTPRVYANLGEMADRLQRSNPQQPREWLEHLARHGARQVEGGYVWKFDPWAAGDTRTSMEIRAEELERFWEVIECPVLLLFAGGSGSARAVQRHDAAALFTHAKAVRSAVIPNVGHGIQHDDPARTISEIRAFLDVVDGRA